MGCVISHVTLLGQGGQGESQGTTMRRAKADAVRPVQENNRQQE